MEYYLELELELIQTQMVQKPMLRAEVSGVARGRPHVRLANAEGPFGYKLALPRAILREGGPFGEGGRGAARARLAEVLELALE